jgi:hypothetical protein
MPMNSLSMSGPTLPPHLMNKAVSYEEDDDYVGPALPSNRVGPAMPYPNRSPDEASLRRAEEERAREWRRIRGESTAEDNMNQREVSCLCPIFSVSIAIDLFFV